MSSEHLKINFQNVLIMRLDSVLKLIKKSDLNSPKYFNFDIEFWRENSIW